MTEYASKDDLGGEEEWEDVDLPKLGKKVRVRYLSTPEVGQLGYLPDLADFASLASQLTTDPGKVDASAYMTESAKYECHVVHVATSDIDAEQTAVKCEACGIVHPPSLWSVKQASRLHSKDVKAIVDAAMKMVVIAQLRPLSQAQTEGDSSEPAVTGA